MIRTFNTGRQYSAEGQRIAYRVTSIKPDEDVPGMDWATVEFADIDRGISGVLSIMLMSEESVTGLCVLNAYDAGGYGWLPHAAEDELKAAFQEPADPVAGPAGRGVSSTRGLVHVNARKIAAYRDAVARVGFDRVRSAIGRAASNAFELAHDAHRRRQYENIVCDFLTRAESGAATGNGGVYGLLISCEEE